MPQSAKPTLLDRLKTQLLRVLPQHLLAAGMYRLMRARTPWLKNLLIQRIGTHYGIDLADAEQPDAGAFPSFNAFFTRALKPGARPIADGMLVSPADGSVSQIGAIDGRSLLQAKGHSYDLLVLLAGDKRMATQFEDGLFATIYLSPKDYHRVHMPFAGTLRSMVFVPGSLFSVSDATAQLVPGLFARNERVIAFFDTDIGPLAVILVGAIFVGSMETVWHGEVRGRGGEPTRWIYAGEDRREFAVGDEIGRFNMGSTVIVLLSRGAASWASNIGPGSHVRMGEAIGRITVVPTGAVSSAAAKN